MAPSKTYVVSKLCLLIKIAAEEVTTTGQ